MKNKIILLLVAVLLQHSFVSGQTLAMASDNLRPVQQTFSSTYSFGNNRKPSICAATITGAVFMSVGFTIFWVGIGEQIDDGLSGSGSSSGGSLSGAGVGLFAVGTGLLIGGIIHDVHTNRGSRWSIITPRKNQVGLAYNF